MPGEIKAVGWGSSSDTLRILDQTALPSREVWLELRTVDDVVEAIQRLRVRGAPLIGVAAAMGLVVALTNLLAAHPERTEPELVSEARRLAGVLRAARPTGRNLGWAMERMTRVLDEGGPLGAGALVTRLRAEAQGIADEDADHCVRMGEAGVELLPHSGRVGILTHCNTGRLATAGTGTALATVYQAHANGAPEIEVFACETRPLLQGARLTAWELSRAGVPVTVIADSMAGALLASGRIGLVIVGADAIARNGDVANKIGTYGLAVLAAHHGVPFYVAAPSTTIDLRLPHGGAIPIESRDPSELSGTPPTVPDGVPVWTPAFDVTPAALITAIVTEQGIVRPPFTPRIADVARAAPLPASERPDSLD